MEFAQIVEYAKNGLTMPKISSQSEQLAYRTIACILAEFSNQLITSEQAKKQKEQAEQLFSAAKREEADRLGVYRAYQKNIMQTEELLHELNKEQRKPQPDKDRLLTLALTVVERVRGNTYAI